MDGPAITRIVVTPVIRIEWAEDPAASGDGGGVDGDLVIRLGKTCIVVARDAELTRLEALQDLGHPVRVREHLIAVSIEGRELHHLSGEISSTIRDLSSSHHQVWFVVQSTEIVMIVVDGRDVAEVERIVRSLDDLRQIM